MSGVNEQQRDYVLRTVEERGIRLVRLWFTDVLGNLKSFAISPAELENAMQESFATSLTWMELRLTAILVKYCGAIWIARARLAIPFM